MRFAPVVRVSRLAGAAAVVATLVGGCSAAPVTAPATDPPALPAQVAQLALTVEVPTATTAGAIGDVAARPAPGAPSTFASLLGVDGVGVDIARVDRSFLGQYAPGKVRVFVRLRLRNALDRTRMLTPTFPAPPAGEGVYLFTVQSVAVETPGGVSIAGNTLAVRAPSRGAVVPGPEWEGAPYDYVRGAGDSCGAGATTCARWKRFDAPLAPGGTSEWRTASYDIDPTVHHMRLRFVVAADLANR